MQVNVDFSKMSIEEYVTYLYSETDRNKMLCLPGWGGTKETEYTLYSCEMSWNKKDVKSIASTCQKHIDNIIACANKLKSTSDENNPKDVLKGELYEFWNKNLHRFKENVDIGFFEDECSIDGKVFFGEELSQEEQAIYDKYCNDIYKQARKRLGNNDFAYDVLIRSMRYCKLLQLGAPKMIVDNEKRILIEALVFFYHCLSLTKIESIHA